jgi:hypothetical protein
MWLGSKKDVWRVEFKRRVFQAGAGVYWEQKAEWGLVTGLRMPSLGWRAEQGDDDAGNAGTKRKSFGLPREHRHLGHLDTLGTAAVQAVFALVSVFYATPLEHLHSQTGHQEACHLQHLLQPFYLRAIIRSA